MYEFVKKAVISSGKNLTDEQIKEITFNLAKTKEWDSAIQLMEGHIKEMDKYVNKVEGY